MGIGLSVLCVIYDMCVHFTDWSCSDDPAGFLCHPPDGV